MSVAPNQETDITLTTAPATMTDALDLGAVELSVADLGRSLHYYTEAIGLRLLTSEEGSIHLGVPGRPLAVLREIPGAPPAPSSSPGLSHFAPEVPDRADLARFAQHYTGSGFGADLRTHGLADSAYVTDPDGHTVEVTWNRPRDQWPLVDGKPPIIADPITLADLVSEPGSEAPFLGLPSGTRMGHVQLKVTDAGLAETEPFYRDLIGLEVLGRLGGGFLSLGVDGRSLLVVTNRFSEPTSAPAPASTAQLIRVDLLVPTLADLQALDARLQTADHARELTSDALEVRDPSGNLLHFAAAHI